MLHRQIWCDLARSVDGGNSDPDESRAGTPSNLERHQNKTENLVELVVDECG